MAVSGYLLWYKLLERLPADCTLRVFVCYDETGYHEFIYRNGVCEGAKQQERIFYNILNMLSIYGGHILICWITNIASCQDTIFGSLWVKRKKVFGYTWESNDLESIPREVMRDLYSKVVRYSRNTSSMGVSYLEFNWRDMEENRF